MISRGPRTSEDGVRFARATRVHHAPPQADGLVVFSDRLLLLICLSALPRFSPSSSSLPGGHPWLKKQKQHRATDRVDHAYLKPHRSTIPTPLKRFSVVVRSILSSPEFTGPTFTGITGTRTPSNLQACLALLSLQRSSKLIHSEFEIIAQFGQIKLALGIR